MTDPERLRALNDLDEALAGLKRIAEAAGIDQQAGAAWSIGEVCDMIAAWCAARRDCIPGQAAPVTDNNGGRNGWDENGQRGG